MCSEGQERSPCSMIHYLGDTSCVRWHTIKDLGSNHSVKRNDSAMGVNCNPISCVRVTGDGQSQRRKAAVIDGRYAMKYAS